MTEKTELGRQLLEHLKLYQDLGVRWVRPAQAQKAGRAGASATAPAKTVPASRPVLGFASQRSLDDSAALQALPSGDSLDAIRADLKDCRRCRLAATRRNIVFGSGNPKAELMFVGEAPGSDEDEQGLPFVGRAGQLLTKIIESVGIDRKDVFICNIVKCRPPGNRNPEKDEIEACREFVFRQVAVVKPRIICALGAFGAQTLLQTAEQIGRLRGRLYDYRGVKLIPTFHPAYLLRNPYEKRKVWEDMKIIRKYLKESESGSQNSE